MWSTTLSETVRIFLIFIIFFFMVPMFLMKRTEEKIPFLDRFFYGFINMILFMILSVHALVYIKLFDIISIGIIVVVALIIVVKLDKEKERGITKLLANLYLFYDVMDTNKNREKLICNIKNSIKNSYREIRTVYSEFWNTPIYSLSYVIILVLSFAVRMWHSFLHYAYPHLDMYLHLKWVKAIMSNELYLDNQIYPKAMHAVIAFISKLTVSDPYWITRYFGPICAVLLVIAIYFLAYKITNNKYLSLLAMAIYGLIINNNILPSEVFRQTATMPQEFGMLFIVLGLSFLIDYIKSIKVRHLFSFEVCLLISLMAHSFSGLFLIFWTAVTVIFSLIFSKLKFISAVKMVGISVVVVVLSFIPLIVGRLMGKVFHETSLEMVTDVTNNKIAEWLFKKYLYSLIFPDSLLIRIFIFGSIAILIALIIKSFRSYMMNTYLYMSLFTLILFMYMIYNISNLIDVEKLPELLGKSRTGPFLAILLPVIVSYVIFYLMDILFLIFMRGKQTEIEKFKRFVSNCIIITFITLTVANGSYSFNTFYKHVEYDQAAEAYIRIKSEFTKNPNETGNWYVVSTDPQLAQVRGYGWYEEGYMFAHDYTESQVMDPDFRFDFPTNHIFVFVEKKPIIFNEKITIDFSEKELEPISDDPFMQFYQDGYNRAVMEGHIWMLVEAYASTHSGVSIYYEDDEIKIYRIYQEDVDISQQ